MGGKSADEKYTSPLSLKKKVHIFLHFFFLLFKVFFNPSIFSFFLSSSFPSFLQKKGTKKKARGFCVERSKAIQHTRA